MKKNYFKAARTFTIASIKSQKIVAFTDPEGQKNVKSSNSLHADCKNHKRAFEEEAEKRVKHSCLDLSLVF